MWHWHWQFWFSSFWTLTLIKLHSIIPSLLTALLKKLRLTNATTVPKKETPKQGYLKICSKWNDTSIVSQSTVCLPSICKTLSSVTKDMNEFAETGDYKVGSRINPSLAAKCMIKLPAGGNIT